jgi:predicted DNA binding CopG/RHH family protein
MAASTKYQERYSSMPDKLEQAITIRVKSEVFFALDNIAKKRGLARTVLVRSLLERVVVDPDLVHLILPQ